jgi:hypothetical protein
MFEKLDAIYAVLRSRYVIYGLLLVRDCFLDKMPLGGFLLILTFLLLG